MLGWSSINDQGDASSKLIKHMLRCCRTEASESICARGSERLIQFTHDFSEHTMRTNSHGHRIQPRPNNVRNDLALWQNDRERAGPKFVH
jgi:hypothetical protein